MTRQVFFVAQYGPHFDRMLEAVRDSFRQASTVLGDEFELLLPGQMGFGTRIIDTIRDHIRKADVVIADLSGGSPNVMWETGFAYASGKPVVLISEDIGHVPFDMHGQLVLIYQSNAPLNNLVVRLAESLVDILRSPAQWEANQPAKRPRRRGKVFISYCHADEEFLHRVLVHLRPLERDGLISLWSDTNIKAGDRWREEIHRALNDARIAVLIVSADFLASDFIITNELPPLLVAAEEKGTRIIPLIVKPSRFVRYDQLARFQALNDPKQPVIRMSESEREELYARLAESIELELGSESADKNTDA